jgi:hypothetical protein
MSDPVRGADSPDPYIYVAASWRTARQPEIVAHLRAEGFDVYDFRNPEPGNEGFAWREIDPDWQRWSPTEFVAAMGHPVAEAGFACDMNALKRATHVVLLQPSGRSAALEMGYACGAGKHTAVLLAEGQEPELMLKMADLLTPSVEAVVGWLRATTVPGRLRQLSGAGTPPAEPLRVGGGFSTCPKCGEEYHNSVCHVPGHDCVRAASPVERLTVPSEEALARELYVRFHTGTLGFSNHTPWSEQLNSSRDYWRGVAREIVDVLRASPGEDGERQLAEDLRAQIPNQRAVEQAYREAGEVSQESLRHEVRAASALTGGRSPEPLNEAGLDAACRMIVGEVEGAALAGWYERERAHVAAAIRAYLAASPPAGGRAPCEKCGGQAACWCDQPAVSQPGAGPRVPGAGRAPRPLLHISPDDLVRWGEDGPEQEEVMGKDRIAGEAVSDAVGEEFGRLIAERDEMLTAVVGDFAEVLGYFTRRVHPGELAWEAGFMYDRHRTGFYERLEKYRASLRVPAPQEGT